MERPLPAYRGDEPYIFVSYAHEDSDLVFPEIQWLKDQGFNIWHDEGISPSSEWHTELTESIENSNLFLYFITPRSVTSDHCQREVHYVIDHKKQLLTVHLEETQLPPGLGLSLSSIQAIMCHELDHQDYRFKLLKGTSDHIQRGIALASGSDICWIPLVRLPTCTMAIGLRESNLRKRQSMTNPASSGCKFILPTDWVCWGMRTGPVNSGN